MNTYKQNTYKQNTHKQNTHKHPLKLLAALLLAANAATAQDLRLFEEIEAEPTPQNQQRVPERVNNQAGQPAFTLRSSSRFGDTYRLVLVNRSGQAAKVAWREGERAVVEGYNGFAVVGASANGVTLAQPAEDGCMASDTAGVSCTGNNMAMLRMTPASPLAVNGNSPQPSPPFASIGVRGGRVDAAEPAVMVDANGQQVFINPFSGQPEVVQQVSEEERLAREARQQERAARLGAFEVQRIDPADVPPGMRVVRTPFGDRMVPNGN